VRSSRSCFFCEEKVAAVDEKTITQLRRFISGRRTIRGRCNTGTCRKHQKQVSSAAEKCAGLRSRKVHHGSVELVAAAQAESRSDGA
jgi:ribosomal protein S18